MEERIVQGVEVEVEGERWITDLVEAEESVSAAKKGKKVGSGWEEGNGNEQVPSGQWRRRRWIRMVRRKGVSGNDYSSSSRSN